MRNRTPVSAIMTREVITLHKSDSLETAELLFKSKKIRHIPVVNGSHIIGMLSYNDLMRISFADAIDEREDAVDSLVYNMFTVDKIMVSNVISVPSTATIKEVAKILSKNEFHALPIVDDTNLVGIVTTTDLINYLLQQFEETGKTP